MTIQQKLKILHAEDDPLDTALVKAFLSREGMECEITPVSSRDDFLKALESGSIDVVLSDYNMPNFMGDEALAIVREEFPETPFIFVSGAIGEERATEVIRQGATDYVMKERLGRLSIAIRRAMEEAEEHRQRRAVETQLQAEQELLSDLFAGVQDGIVVLNQNLEIVRTNPTIERVFSHLSPLTGKPWSAFCEPVSPATQPHAPAAETTLNTGRSTQEYRKCRTTRGEADFSIFAFPMVERRTGNRTGVILYLHEVTRELALHRALIQAQKMECVGQLAGNVAHDFNNMLQSILIAADTLSDSIQAGDPRRDQVEEIEKAANQALMLTRQLSTFSSSDSLSQSLVNLSSLAGNMGKLLNRLVVGGVVFRFDLDPNLPLVKCDPGRIEQVILNLVTNARDAMPEGGEITLRTTHREITTEEAPTHGAEWRPGHYACVTIRDTGMGIPPDVLPHMFEPFFTTKAPGKGTGLGLSTVYGIIKQHNGWIDVDSKPGEGSSFTVYLPAETPGT